MNGKQEGVKRSVINGAPIVHRNPLVGVRFSTRQTVTKPMAKSVQVNSGVQRTAPKPVATAKPVTAKPVAPAKPVTAKPVAPAKPVASKPAQVPVKTENGQKNASAKSDKESNSKQGTKNKNNKLAAICGVGVGILACIGIGVGIAIAMNNNNNSGEGEGDAPVSNVIEENTEEIQRITDETVSKYTDIKVEGYQHVENESFTGDAVVISVTNISEEMVSLAITMGAYDGDGNVLETSSMYAEGIEPGQTHVFNTFVFTNLTPEQLQSATYKVYKASTYNATGTEETVVEGEQQEVDTTTEPVDLSENIEATE